MKTEVYSWRLSADLKGRLEREARRRNTSVSSVLDLAAQEWLTRANAECAADEKEQKRLQRAATACFGVLAGGNPHHAETASEGVKARLRKRHGR